MTEGNIFSPAITYGGGGGYPMSGLDRGRVPHPRSRWGGVTPSQVQLGGGGYTRVPPIQDWIGYLPVQTPPPPSAISNVNTCYAAGGVPLAFTQEDFLVLRYICSKHLDVIEIS